MGFCSMTLIVSIILNSVSSSKTKQNNKLKISFGMFLEIKIFNFDNLEMYLIVLSHSSMWRSFRNVCYYLLNY